MTATLYIRVPAILKREVERAAAKKGLSVNVYVQRVLEDATRDMTAMFRKTALRRMNRQLAEESGLADYQSRDESGGTHDDG